MKFYYDSGDILSHVSISLCCLVLCFTDSRYVETKFPKIYNKLPPKCIEFFIKNSLSCQKTVTYEYPFSVTCTLFRSPHHLRKSHLLISEVKSHKISVFFILSTVFSTYLARKMTKILFFEKFSVCVLIPEKITMCGILMENS